MFLKQNKTKTNKQNKKNKTTQRVTKKVLEEKDMFITLIVVMASQVYAYVQTPQIVYTRYVHSFIYQLYLNKAAFGLGGEGSASLVAQMVKNLPAMQETQARSLGQEDPLENRMATQSSILSWRIPWTQRNLAGYSLWGHKESDMNE